MTVLTLTLILFALGVFTAAAVTDFKKLRIPNILPALAVLCFAVAWGTDAIGGGERFDALSRHVTVGSVALAVTLVLFFTHTLGGGDAKLIPAACLWVGTAGLAHFLLVMTVAGAVLALVSIALRKTAAGKAFLGKAAARESMRDGWIAAMARDENAVPYGIAIALGALAGFPAAGLLP